MLDENNSGSPATTGTQKLFSGEGMGWLWRSRPLRRWLGPFCGSVVGISIIIWLVFRLNLNITTGAFLFLIMVVLSAAYGGFWSGTLTSILAAACLDYFFFPPIFHFDMNDPMDWVALGTFEFTALVITLLQEQAQFKAAEAAAARQGSERLLQRRARDSAPQQDWGIGRSNRLFDSRRICRSAGLRYLMRPRRVSSRAGIAHAEDGAGGSRRIFSEFGCLRPGYSNSVLRPCEWGRGRWGAWPYVAARCPVSAAQAIASLCAIALERARSFEKETRAEAARQAEQLRSAVVEALAHQIKTPLCVIQAASSSLPAWGSFLRRKPNCCLHRSSNHKT